MNTLSRNTIEVLNTLFARAIKATVNGDPKRVTHCNAIANILNNASEAGCEVRAAINAYDALCLAVSGYKFDGHFALTKTTAPRMPVIRVPAGLFTR